MKKIVITYVLVAMAITISILLLIVISFPCKYTDEVKNSSMKYDLDMAMILSVINIESGFNNESISNKGAVGLMQILPSTAMEVAEKLNIDIDSMNCLKDAEINIEIGCYYLKYLLNYFNGNVTNALCAYNWGMGNVREWINAGNVNDCGDIINIPTKETLNYLDRYEINYRIYRDFYHFK